VFELLERLLDRAMAAGATYADARHVTRASESLQVKNGAVEAASASTSAGIGVRVLADGAWGFAATSSPAPVDIESTVGLAVQLARAASRAQRQPVMLADVEPAVDEVHTLVQRDPLEVPMDERLQLLLDCDAAMRSVEGVRIAQASMDLRKETSMFASSEGARVQQERIETGAGIEATAVQGGEVQRRSYPAAFGGDYACRGYEFVQEMDLKGHAEDVAREAVKLLSAPACPSDVTTLVLTGSHLGLQVHESCGHPIELDRVLGTEASFAGTSFLTPDRLGRFRYGSNVVNITADATLPGALGSFAYDDEGVPGQRVDIVREGIFCGYLTSRETAPAVGLAPNGTMRADGWNRMPLIRMTNINLLPGDWTLDEIIEDTADGILMDATASWSIDDRRLNFQFGTQLGQRIDRGSLGPLLRNCTYTGVTPQFWRSCDAVAGAREWRVWGLPNCGKGEPMQVARVGHGVSAARFRNVRVGIMADGR
jgi:TldD protein